MHDNLLRISNSENQAVPSIEIEFLWLKVNPLGLSQEDIPNTLRSIDSVRWITLVLLVVIVLALIGIGWKTFSVGVIHGCDRVIDVITASAKVTQGTRDIANDPNFVMTD